MEIARIFSYGGGVQSTAALVLAVKNKINYRTFVFANTGDDSENPATLDYVRNIARPFAERNGIQLVEIARRKRNGESETLYRRLVETKRSIAIPARLGDSGAPGFRACTIDFKIRVIDKWCRENKFTKIIIGLGISLDELERIRSSDSFRENGIEKSREYPLIDLRLNRSDCLAIIKDAGLRMPEKSACYFCPFHSHSSWVKLKKENTELFNKAVKLEKFLQDKKRPAERFETCDVHRHGNRAAKRFRRERFQVKLKNDED